MPAEDMKDVSWRMFIPLDCRIIRTVLLKIPRKFVGSSHFLSKIRGSINCSVEISCVIGCL